MSKTTRRHEALSASKRRGPKNKPYEEPNDRYKTTKQIRMRDREVLRRSWRG